MSARPPAAPPSLTGFQYLRHLGSGGFADVYLYEEQLLGRKVAVKVLLSGKLGADALRHFTNEANLMAQLSNHPSIVSVYSAGVSDDGRPYLVMEYCSRPNLQARYRAQRFSEAEALRVGVQIAGAIETAHRAGILHRDIKPANILSTDYGRPALTDFGIAATTSSGVQTGMSVPWAPPEALAADGRGDERSDVYSLAATLYTLLAGRTPFEVPGTSNTSVELMSRVHTLPLPPLGRQDVSASFERVLATAMAKRPAERYGSAMEFARALQRVQIELGMQATTVDVVEDVPEQLDEEEDGGFTRIRSVVTIEAQPVAAPPPAPVSGLIDEVGSTQLRGYQPAPLATPAAPPVADTDLRPPAVIPEPPAPARRSPLPLVLGSVAAVAVIGVTVAVFVNTGAQQGTVAPTVATTSDQPIDPVGNRSVPDVTDVVGRIAGTDAVFSWANPEEQPGDRYRWRLVELTTEHGWDENPLLTEAELAIPALASGQTCIEVKLVRADGGLSRNAVRGCTP